MKISKKKAEKTEKQKVILSSLKESFHLVRKKKFQFAVLFFTQLIFLISFMFLAGFFVEYSSNMLGSMDSFFQGMESNPIETPEDANALLTNYDSLAAAYDTMIEFRNKVIVLAAIAVLIYIILGGVNWDLAHLMVNEESPFVLYEFLFAVSILFFSFASVVFSYLFYLVFTFSGEGAIAKLILAFTSASGFPILLLFTVLVAYLSFISFGLIYKYKLNQIMQLFSHTFMLGYKRFLALFPGFLIVNAAAVLFGYFIFLSLKYYPGGFFPVISILLFAIALILGKLFFLLIVRNCAGSISVKSSDDISANSSAEKSGNKKGGG